MKQIRIIICLVCALAICVCLSVHCNKQDNTQAEMIQPTQTTQSLTAVVTSTVPTTTTTIVESTVETTSKTTDKTSATSTSTSKNTVTTTTTNKNNTVSTTMLSGKVSSNFGKFKSYTDYRMLSKSSSQWKLQEQAYTDENGLRKIGDAYLVAMGSYYGTTLGTRYKVKLSNGSVFDVILCDCKQDRHTDSLHRECLSNGSVLEFYVDSSALPKKVKTMGTVSAIPYFSGSVVSIEKYN